MVLIIFHHMLLIRSSRWSTCLLKRLLGAIDEEVKNKLFIVPERT